LPDRQNEGGGCSAADGGGCRHAGMLGAGGCLCGSSMMAVLSPRHGKEAVIVQRFGISLPADAAQQVAGDGNSKP